MNEECTPGTMREHERRITSAERDVASAHERITASAELIKEFTIEMRASNKNIAELVTGVKTLTIEVRHITTSVAKHESDIQTIKNNMETKDTVLKLYGKIESSDGEYKKGLDAVMAKLRSQEEKLDAHTEEPARQALADQKAIKTWLFAGFGSVLVAIMTAAIMFVLF